MSNQKDKFSKNIKSLAAAQSINFIYPIAIFPVIGSNIGSNAFGELMAYYAIAIILSTIIDYGFSLEGPRLTLNNQNSSPRLTRIYICITAAKLLISIPCILFSYILYFLIYKNTQNGIELYSIAIIPIALGAALSPQWLLHGLSRLHKFVLLSAIVRLSTFALYFLLKPNSAYAACIAISSPLLVTSILSYPSLPIRSQLSQRLISYKYILQTIKESTPVFISNILTLPYTQGGIILLSYFHGPAAVAFYAAADRIIRPVIAINGVVFQAAYPLACSKSTESNFYKKPFYITLAVSILSFVFIFIFAENIIFTIYKKEFFPAVLTLKILSVILLINPFAMTASHLGLIAIGEGKVTYKIYLITSITYCLFSPLIIYSQGSIGAVISTVTAEIIATSMLTAAAMRIRNTR